MKRLSNNRINKAFLLALGLASCVFTQKSVEDISGTSVGTGNPGKVKVSFKDGDAPAPFTGRLEIYGSTQIPIPFYSPNPLAFYNLTGPTEFTLTPEHFSTIPDTAWPKSSVVGDSIYNFNIILQGSEVGSILTGLAFNSRSKTFEAKVDSLQDPKTGKPLGLTATLVPLQPFQGFIPPRNLEPARYNFLFIYGTGYFSESDSGLFSFPPMPKGRYDLSFVTLPGKIGNILSGEDTAYTYRMVPSVYTDTKETLSDSGIIEGIRLPEELIHK